MSINSVGVDKPLRLPGTYGSRRSDSFQRSGTWVSWRRVLLHPLMAICLVQAGLSLSLVWVNTAFTDEAEYLWAGHLVVSQWLHGTSVPPLLDETFSGSPIIYPPVGALADTVGGLVAARILSLAFMLAATVLLYRVATKVFGRMPALVGAALWAVSEPAIRLGAFATYDALSVFLTALSVWLVVQAGCRRQRGELVAAAAIALGLANGTAYSGLVIDPVVIAFAFLVWVPDMGARQARFASGWLFGTCLIAFAAVLTISQSWRGFIYTIVLRGTTSGFTTSKQPASLILKSVWAYSGYCIALATLGAVMAIVWERRSFRVLVVVLATAALVVPIVQVRDSTEVSLDKHLAYGIWFAVMAAGYAFSKVLRPPRLRRPLVALVCSAAAIAYPAVNNWESSWYKQTSWSNAKYFIASFKPIAERSRGLIYASTQTYIARYYTREGLDWQRWVSVNALNPNPPPLPQRYWQAFYTYQLQHSHLAVIALFYTTSLRYIPAKVLFGPKPTIASSLILDMVAANTSKKGLSALTLSIAHDPTYRVVATGPYNTPTIRGTYVIWQKVAG